MDIPRDKKYPVDSVQCDSCGGFGCQTCGNKGWLTPASNPAGRRCLNPPCNEPILPAHPAVYCSNHCALDDAH